MMREVVQEAESRMQALAQKSAQGMDETRRASEEALEAVRHVREESQQSRQSLQSQMDQVYQRQDQVQGSVSTLHDQLKETRKQATYQSAVQDFTRRTDQASVQRTVAQQMQQQNTQLEATLRHLQHEIAKLKIDRLEKDAQIQELSKAVQDERTARGELQQFVDEAMDQLTPAELMEMDE